MHLINKKLTIMASTLSVAAAAATLATSSAWAASHCRAPTWFNGPETVTDGDHMIVRCTATAIVDEIAEMRATQTCENTAIAEVLIRALKNRPARSATEVGPPADLAPPPCIVGLVCDSPRMRSCKSEDEVTIWRRCSYNIVAAHEGSKKECGVPPTVAHDEPPTVAEEPAASSSTPTSPAPAATPSGELTPPMVAATEGTPSADVPPKPDAPLPPASDFVLTVTTNPICDEIIIGGATERRYQCPSTLMEIPITVGDTTVTVRARGYSDKLIHVESLSAEHKLDVALEPLTSP